MTQYYGTGNGVVKWTLVMHGNLKSSDEWEYATCLQIAPIEPLSIYQTSKMCGSSSLTWAPTPNRVNIVRHDVSEEGRVDLLKSISDSIRATTGEGLIGIRRVTKRCF